MKITQEVTAWLTGGHSEFSAIDPENPRLGSLGYTNSPTVGMEDCGWTKLGPATVTLEIPSQDALVNAKVDSLRAEITKTRADAQAKVTQLEGQIANLLALPMSAEAEQ